MAAIVSANAPLLKAAGFKKRRYGFNRVTDDGLVHVVHFWMAPKEPPAWTEVPGLRERLYGNFRLDFGVWVPEMTRSGGSKSSGDWINEYNCELRRTVGQLMTPAAPNFWWSLFDSAASQGAGAAISALGLPWLDRFPSKEAILSAFEAEGRLGLGMTPAGALDIALLYEGLHRSAEARRTLEAYVSEPVLGSHAQYLGPYLEGIGHGDLVSRISVRE